MSCHKFDVPTVPFKLTTSHNHWEEDGEGLVHQAPYCWTDFYIECRPFGDWVCVWVTYGGGRLKEIPSCTRFGKLILAYFSESDVDFQRRWGSNSKTHGGLLWVVIGRTVFTRWARIFYGTESQILDSRVVWY